MKTKRSVQVVTEFESLDLHDDGLASVKIYPSRSKNNVTKIDIELLDDSTGVRKVLSFRSCANLRFIMDFDVLADNWFAQADQVTAKANVRQLQRFVRTQTAHWHLKYMPPSPRDKPITKKLASIRNYVLFKLTFFGGTVELLAKDFAMTGEGSSGGATGARRTPPTSPRRIGKGTK